MREVLDKNETDNCVSAPCCISRFHVSICDLYDRTESSLRLTTQFDICQTHFNSSQLNAGSEKDFTRKTKLLDLIGYTMMGAGDKLVTGANMINNAVLTAKEAASFLKAHVETIRRLARREVIPAFKVGKDWRFHAEALKKWSKGQQAPFDGIE